MLDIDHMKRIKSKKIPAFSLVELLITTTIIVLLANFAIGAYNDYIGQGKLTEAEKIASSILDQMKDYYTSNGQWPNATELGLINTNDNFAPSATNGWENTVLAGFNLLKSGDGFEGFLETFIDNDKLSLGPILSGCESDLAWNYELTIDKNDVVQVSCCTNICTQADNIKYIPINCASAC